MFIVTNGREHDMNAERIVEQRIFVELAADTIDLVVVIWVRQVDLVGCDADDGTCVSMGLGFADMRRWECDLLLTIFGMHFVDLLIEGTIFDDVVVPEG